MRAAALVLLVFLAATAGAASPSFSSGKKLDAYFDALAKHQLANGSIAITEKGVPVYQRSVGSAIISPQGNEAADDATRYRIGPVSELFTAALVMQLVEGASITLDSSLAEFFPDLPNALEITYRDLLQHRSGLANYTAAPDFETWRRTPKTHADLLKIIAAAGARFPPRARVEYNDSNYLLLGYVLEKVRERSFDDILQRQISARLGLARTYYAGGGITSLESVSYRVSPAGWAAQVPTDPSIHGGAGGLVSTPGDLVTFIDALFSGKVVSEHSLASMRSQEGGSGMGLWPYQQAGQIGFGHAGGIERFRTCVYYFPDRKLAISYATNAALIPMDEIVDESLSLIFERGRKPPTFEPVKLTANAQAEYAGAWRFAEGRPDETPFRNFATPDEPIVLAVRAGTDAPLVTIGNRDHQSTALGGHEFALRELGYFLRFDPRANELVLRGPDGSYYLKRAR
jgi:CubicO group peptidase (beta-lactamase class C family)